jgi:CheY-like chemotaxis protein
MPGDSGLVLLNKVKERYRIPVIVMTAYSDLDSAVSSFQGGAFSTSQAVRHRSRGRDSAGDDRDADSAAGGGNARRH